MDIYVLQICAAPAPRCRTYCKAKVLAACDAPGASISGVALAHGLNANLVRQWRAGRGAKIAGATAAPPTAHKAAETAKGVASPLVATSPEFIAIEMPALAKAATRAAVEPQAAAPIAEPLIQVELRRGPLHLNVRWPTSGAQDCTAWLRELTTGLLK